MIRAPVRLFFAATALTPLPVLAQMSPPSFTAANNRQLFEGYPSDLAAKGRSVAALVELWSTANGSVYRCEVKKAFGDPKLASQVCRIFLPMRIVPAKGIDGTRAIGRIQILARFYVAGSPDTELVKQARQGPDLELTVQTLAGQKEPIDVEIVLAVDEKGKVQSCGPAAGARKAYATAACGNVGSLPLPEGRDISMTPVPYVTSAKVRFQPSGTGVEAR